MPTGIRRVLFTLVLAAAALGLTACGGGGGGGGDGGGPDVTPPAVTATPAGGTYNADKNVTLAANEAASIYYTIDGSTPTAAASPKYNTTAIAITATTTLKFIGVDTAGNTSAVKTETYTIDKVAPTVSASPAGGSFISTQSVALSANETATIYYTTNGTDPTTAATQYTVPIALGTGTWTLKFIGVDAASNQSAVKTETYTVTSGPPKTAKVISGSVTVAAAGATKAAAVQNAVVEAESFTKDDVQVGSASVLSGDTGFYTLKIDMPDAGGYLVLRTSRDGFTETTKRVDFAAPQNFTGNLEMQSVVTVVAAKGTAIKASGQAVPGFTFGVVRYGDGTRKAVGGAAALAAAKAVDAVTELQIDVPATSVPDATETLVGKLKSYDPNDATDARNFPGDYVDQDGNRLLSVAFDFMQITDQNGTSLADLTVAAKQAGKAANEPTVVRRWIPTDSCPSLDLGDAKGDVAGFQVPVYTLNRVKGIWDLLGEGTVVDSNGTLIAIGNVTPANCQTSGYYLDILVSNEDFLRNWWNLDYPLVFSEPVQVCIEKTFVTDKGAPIPSVSVDMQDDDAANSFAHSYGYTDNDGKVTLTVILLNNNDSDRTAALSYWNPYSYQYETETVTLGDAPNCTTKTNTVTAPDWCDVQGRLVDDQGAPVPGELVWFNGAGGSSYYLSTYTDAQGEFSAQVICDSDFNAYVGWDSTPDASFNVNGATTDFPDYEKTDDGSVVVLNDLIPVNNPPQASGYLASSTIRTTGATKAYLYGWDGDGDYPLSWTLMKGSTTEAQGQIASGGYQAVADLSGAVLGEGNHVLKLVVTDSRGASTEAVIGTLSVTAPGANRPPNAYAYADTYAITAPGELINFYSYAWDLDGDPLAYEWKVNGASVGSEQSMVYTVPQTAKDGDVFEVELTVSDGLAQTRVGFTLYFGTPAQVDVIIR